ncbi:MAG: GIY-YIG nuclease family protein [Oscillospiraceae bacterium]|nr:GIY-YIG nuclease family protein [Oscillospiraceae bacterium]
MNVVYMLRCRDGSLYTGWTNDLEKRLKTHAAGRGGRYTRSRLPVELVYVERFDTPAEARSREWHLKRLSRGEKLRLIAAAEKCPGDEFPP